jgi:hypothetical protein
MAVTTIGQLIESIRLSTTTSALRICSSTEWTSVDALEQKLLELQNRWSASLAMSTDGSFPSRPRQFRIRGVTADPEPITDRRQPARRAIVLTA